MQFYDVNGDGFCTPNGVLRIINFLNGSGGEGEATTHAERAISRRALAPVPYAAQTGASAPRLIDQSWLVLPSQFAERDGAYALRIVATPGGYAVATTETCEETESRECAPVAEAPASSTLRRATEGHDRYFGTLERRDEDDRNDADSLVDEALLNSASDQELDSAFSAW